MQNLLIRALFLWFLFVPVAIANGIIMEAIYLPLTGDLLAHQISTLIAITAFIFLSFFILGKGVINVNSKNLLLIGLLWVTMTAFFEFIFGHYIDRFSWGKLLEDYNLLHGRVWGLVLVIELFTPLINKFLRTRKV